MSGACIGASRLNIVRFLQPERDRHPAIVPTVARTMLAVPILQVSAIDLTTQRRAGSCARADRTIHGHTGEQTNRSKSAAGSSGPNGSRDEKMTTRPVIVT